MHKEKEVVVTGLSLRLPKTKDKQQFWDMLTEGKSSIANCHLREDKHKKDGLFSLLEDIDLFDNKFFNTSERESVAMDPQQRLLLEESYQCILDSAIPLTELSKDITDVYVGSMGNDYAALTMEIPEFNSYSYLGNNASILANRVSHFFDLQGKSVPVQTASSSSLVAIDSAIRSIKNSKCEYALVAGVTLNFHPWKARCFDESMMLSHKAGSRPFDGDGDGYAIGDGIIVMLLQSKQKALENNQRIYGVLKGSAVCHGGKALSLQTPQLHAQEKVIQQALDSAQINPSMISYVEAHGSGTSAGDPVEYESIVNRYGKNRKLHLNIGSIKANYGHLEAAAGILGLAKVLLMLENEQIPPTLNHDVLNPLCSFSGHKAKICTEQVAWRSSSKKQALTAAVNSFGIGGVNAHVIVQQYKTQRAVNRQEPGVLFVPLSSKTENSLKEAIEVWSEHLLDNHNNQYDITGNLVAKREQLSWRSGCLIRKCDEKAKLIFSKPIHTGKPSEMTSVELCCDDKHDHESLTKFSDGYTCVEKLTQKTLKNLESCSTLKEALKDFNSGKPWPDESRVIYSFLSRYLMYSVLLQAGVKPEVAKGKTNDTLLLLVLAEVISLKESLCYIADTQYSIENYHAPKFPILLSSSDAVIDSYRVSSAYISHLLKSGVFRSKANLQELIQNFNTLYDHSEGFRRLTAELVIEDITFNSWLGFKKSTKKKYEMLHQYMLFGGILSLVKYTRKWGIRYEEKYLSSYGIELISLLEDNIINMSHVKAVLRNEGYNGTVIKRIPTSQYKNYSELYRFNEASTVKTLKRLIEASQSSLDLDETNSIEHYLKLTKQGRSLLFSSRLSLIETLGTFWELGVDIEWNYLFPRETYNHKDIPGYVFERQSFWLENSYTQSNTHEIIKSERNPDPTTDETENLPLQVLNIVSLLIGRAPAELQYEQRLSDIGFDSILETKLKYQLENQFNTKIPISLLASDLTINDLMQYITLNSKTSASGDSLTEQFLNKNLNIENLTEKQMDTLLVDVLSKKSELMEELQ
ncbi:type I polyketide synthase [Photobacterium lutimaris]|uniref:Uncharacterized protein n=1 Tax=Photobacterium lutimaris TaxID=388278 RepID=A0A2T3J2G5_9GAMM|nr:type I polyketide synthase [Photobacterium lutimaris]PSU35482.1 hypothetical protein C9I99_00205 [Photobacterium lutimaris]TDR78527.1 phosphopantetheine binding protein [Photobacterium lutimaris]